jgi:hypothetical protein
LHELLKDIYGKEGQVHVLQGETGWRTPEETWMEDERKEEEEVMFVNMVRQEEEELEEETTASDEEMQEEIKRAQAAVDECYCRQAERAGIEVKTPKDRLLTEEELDNLSERLGDGVGARAKRRKEIERMSIVEMEAEAEEVREEIKRRRGRGASRVPLMLTLLCLTCPSVEGFTAYDCSNRSNIVESYSLLEPDVCANMGKEGEVETTVYGEIVQIKQDRMIPVFRCVVIETVVSQYCGMFLAAGVTRYIRFREPRTLEAWECRQARKNGKVVINGRTFQAKIGSTSSHSMFMNGGLDEKSNCEVGIISFPNGQTLGGQAAQALYEITLREEFARLNELTGTLTLASGVQAMAGDKSIVDSLEGTVVWVYDSVACPQTIVRLYGE